MKWTTILVANLTAAVILAPAPSWACGCSCGTFDVRTSSMLPTGEGGTAFMEFNYVDQDQNWSHSSRAPAADNEDKQIRTEFYTAGVQYMFTRSWGALAEIPFENRMFRVAEGEDGEVEQFEHFDLGDMRIKGIYTGFSPDMSSGLTFGLKLPTGEYKEPGFDWDTQIGTGSTDILLGAFTRGQLPGLNQWDWFMSGQWDQPALTQDEYKPGAEVNGVAGIYYRGWNIGSVKIAPVGQAIGTVRWHDRGSEAHVDESAYERVLLAPGIEASAGQFSLYGDVAFPVYQHVDGNQLVAEELYTLRAAYNF